MHVSVEWAQQILSTVKHQATQNWWTSHWPHSHQQMLKRAAPAMLGIEASCLRASCSQHLPGSRAGSQSIAEQSRALHFTQAFTVWSPAVLISMRGAEVKLEVLSGMLSKKELNLGYPLCRLPHPVKGSRAEQSMILAA